MIRRVIWCVAAMLACGCQSGEAPARTPKTEPIRYSPRAKTPREPVEAPRPESFRVELGDLPDEAAEEPERDLAAELKEAIGTPTDCLTDFTAPDPMTVRISVTATVRPTGMVITPSVYASGLSNRARQCIEKRVGTVVLPALDEPVSQTISTVVEVDYQPPVVVEADPGVPEPRLRDVREPLPKRPEVPPSGIPIQKAPAKLISGGFDGGRPPEGPKGKKIQGPKPRPIDGYDLDENAQEWTN